MPGTYTLSCGSLPSRTRVSEDAPAALASVSRAISPSRKSPPSQLIRTAIRPPAWALAMSTAVTVTCAPLPPRGLSGQADASDRRRPHRAGTGGRPAAPHWVRCKHARSATVDRVLAVSPGGLGRDQGDGDLRGAEHADQRITVIQADEETASEWACTIDPRSLGHCFGIPEPWRAGIRPRRCGRPRVRCCESSTATSVS